MPTIRIDNREVHVEAGASVLQAARALGLDIPALCYHAGCAPQHSCLCCVVRVNGAGRLVPACATKVVEGMNVDSETPEIHEARRTALELLLADHAGDCLAPCTNVCPAHMDIPLMIRHIQNGDLREALITVKRMIALPAVLGRICPELCERGCRRAVKDSPVSICRLKRHVADEDLASGNPYLPPCEPASGKRITIVGSGPTGLAAAWYLLQRGHACVVLDEHEQAGGNLRYAVPRDKLPENVLDAEIALVQKFGAEFRLKIAVGRQVALADLRKECDAVLLCTGEMDKDRAGALGLDMAGKGLKTDRETMMSSMEGVFAAGAAVTPFRHAVRAVAEGREAAELLDLYVRGMKAASRGPAFTVRLGQLSPQEAAVFVKGAAETPRAQPTAQTAGLSIPDARQEALRCLHCDCGKLDDCALRRYSVLYGADPVRYRTERRTFERTITDSSVVYEPGKCIQCGLCVQITEQAREPLGLTYIGRGFQVRIAAPLGETLSAAMQKVAKECCDACPTGAMVYMSKERPAKR